MLVSSAKTFYDGEKNQVAEMSSKIILRNDLIPIYGPETKPTRVEARQFVEDAVDRIWPSEKTQSFELKPANTGQNFHKQLELLEPKNGAQVSAKAQLTSLLLVLKRTYWLIYLQLEPTSIAIPLLVVVTWWLTIIFVSFGMFAPRNATCDPDAGHLGGLAASSAIFIIMSMYSPFSGVLRISPVAVRDARRQMATDQ
jgi:hypothetical protein